MTNIDKQGQLTKIRTAMVVVLLLTLLAQLVDNAFTLITPIFIDEFHISVKTASYIPSIGGIGLAIGFLAFSSFSDFFSEKKLLILGLVLFIFPSVIGLLFQNYYYIVLLARIMQAIGGISTSAIYLVLIARYLPLGEKFIWMGLSTTSYKLSTVVGTLAGGYLTQNFGWQVIFYIPLIAVIAIPILLKTLPNVKKQSSNVEILGFILLALVAVSLNFLASGPSMLLVIITLVVIGIFLMYVNRAKNPLVTKDMLANSSYMLLLLATFLYYLAQVAIVFLLPFVLQGIFGLSIDKVSLVYVLPYLASALVAGLSGNIIKLIGKNVTLLIGAIFIISGFTLMGLFANLGIIYVQVFLAIIVCGYSLSFSPFLSTSIASLNESQVGTGIGIFNFVVRIASVLGISISAFLLNAKFASTQLFSFVDSSMASYTNIFLFLAFTTLIGAVIYMIINYQKGDKDE